MSNKEQGMTNIQIGEPLAAIRKDRYPVTERRNMVLRCWHRQ